MGLRSFPNAGDDPEATTPSSAVVQPLASHGPAARLLRVPSFFHLDGSLTHLALPQAAFSGQRERLSLL